MSDSCVRAVARSSRGTDSLLGEDEATFLRIVHRDRARIDDLDAHRAGVRLRELRGVFSGTPAIFITT